MLYRGCADRPVLDEAGHQDVMCCVILSMCGATVRNIDATRLTNCKGGFNRRGARHICSNSDFIAPNVIGSLGIMWPWFRHHHP